MSELSSIVGQRIRTYRIRRGLSQEALARLCDRHPTYIGQLERGEKNPTLESLERVCEALKIPMSQLLEKVEKEPIRTDDIALQCYDIMCSKPQDEQKDLMDLILAIERYKDVE